MSKPHFLATTLPHIWRAQELAHARETTLSSGHAALDAQLPGGGWPLGSLIEVLQPRPEQHVWQLLLPALVQAVQMRSGPVVLVGAPLQPFGPSLAAWGLPRPQLLCVQADKPAARLWAAEQALHCSQVAAVLAWLPQASGMALRRLNLAAQQHTSLLFVFRTLATRKESSPARLRLELQGTDTLNVHLLKRRGPPLAAPVTLAAQAPRLAALLDARRRNPPGHPCAPAMDLRRVADGKDRHVLDRPVPA